MHRLLYDMFLIQDNVLQIIYPIYFTLFQLYRNMIVETIPWFQLYH